MLLALDPPANIRLDIGGLSRDEVAGASEYHVYYFDGPAPSSTVLGNYVTSTKDNFWPLGLFGAPFGYHTVVPVQTYDQPTPVEFSVITDGEIVEYFSTTPGIAIFPPPLSTGQQLRYLAGDDGDKQAGAQAVFERDIANGDGTFTDALTQLIWIADSACSPLVNWIDAVTYANELTADGNSSTCTSLQDGSAAGDWRLANIVELQSIYNYGQSEPTLDVPLTDVSAVISDDFCSSTSFASAPNPNDIGLAWEIQFLPIQNTRSHIDQKLNLGRAWAARDK